MSEHQKPSAADGGATESGQRREGAGKAKEHDHGSCGEQAAEAAERASSQGGPQPGGGHGGNDAPYGPFGGMPGAGAPGGWGDPQAWGAAPGMGPWGPAPWGMPPQGGGQPPPGPPPGMPWGAVPPGYPPPGYPPPGWAPPPPGMGAPGAQGPGAGAGRGPRMSEVMDEIANGGTGLASLGKLLDLDDTEFWKGALVGAAAVLLLTNETVQKTLLKSGVKAKDGVQHGVERAKAAAGSGGKATED